MKRIQQRVFSQKLRLPFLTQKKYDEYSIAQNREDFNPSTKFETTLSTLGSQINNLKEKAEAFSKTEITTKNSVMKLKRVNSKAEETKTSLNNMSAAAEKKA